METLSSKILRVASSLGYELKDAHVVRTVFEGDFDTKRIPVDSGDGLVVFRQDVVVGIIYPLSNGEQWSASRVDPSRPQEAPTMQISEVAALAYVMKPYFDDASKRSL